MERRALGGLNVSAVGFGCMGMTHAYGAPSDAREMQKLLAEAIDLGYTFFDTAEIYVSDDGSQHNEEVVGEGLRTRRDDLVIATKGGISFGADGGFVYQDSAAQLRSSVEGSLRRLQTDRIDLYYLHRHQESTPIEGVAEVMGELIAEGKILHWGLSGVELDTIERAHAVTPLSAVQNRLSMMARDDVELLPALDALSIGYVAFSPLANGFLTDAYTERSHFGGGDYRAIMPQFAQGADTANAELLQLIRRLAEEHDSTPAGIALAWVMALSPHVVPIPGSRKPERVHENAQAAAVQLSTEEVFKIASMLDVIETSGVFGGRSR